VASKASMMLFGITLRISFKVISLSSSPDSTPESNQSHNLESVTSSTVGFLDTGVCFGGHFGKFGCQILMLFFFLAIEMSGYVIVGPRDADLQHRIINSAGILACYVMKTQPHVRPNLRGPAHDFRNFAT
jgi:hypothetical protein